MTNRSGEILEIYSVMYDRSLAIFQQRKRSVELTQKKIKNIEAQRKLAYAGLYNLQAYKKIGADHKWQTWLGTRTTQLQQEMAINMALAIEAFSAVQEDFVKLEAMKNIAKKNRLINAQKQSKTEQKKIESIGLIRQSLPDTSIF